MHFDTQLQINKTIVYFLLNVSQLIRNLLIISRHRGCEIIVKWKHIQIANIAIGEML